MNKALLEEILELDSRLIALETPEVETVLVQYRLICRQSGQSIYHWSPEGGMVSMKAADISVPGCRKLVDAARHIVQSMHYGVYVLTDFSRELTGGAVEQLRKIPDAKDARKVIFLASALKLPRLLERLAHQVAVEPAQESSRPRLRDGRWVV